MMRIGRLPAANQARLGGNEFQVRLVAQALGLGDSELALVDFGLGRPALPAPRVAPLHVIPCLRLIPAKQFSHRALVSPPVVMRRPRDRCRIVGV